MNRWLVGLLVVALGAAFVPSMADAKRLGGGKSSGMQRDMPARTAPDATPPRPAAPAQATPGTAAAAGGAAAAAGKRSWMGPIAGLAAGLGIAALMSSMGMGEAFGNFLTIILLAVAAFFLVRFLLRRFGPTPTAPRLAAAGAGSAGGQSAGGWMSPPAQLSGAQGGPLLRTSDSGGPAGVADAETGHGLQPPSSDSEGTLATPSVARTVQAAFVPAAFDAPGFERIAKTIFIRLQAANDSADIDDLRRFTTPELFAELKMDLQDRGRSLQHTDVLHVDAQVLDVADEADRQVVSVRFGGRIREDKDAEPSDFSEVWHLVKRHGDDSAWAIAGIEQVN